MARSKVVVSVGDNKHRSRLVTSMQLLDSIGDEYIKPSGVWGAVAVIKCGDVTIKSEELDFEFEIPFDDDLESNEGEIIVYNLSSDTIKQLKKNASISIEAGYQGDTGVIFNGTITKVSTKRQEADRVTTIRVVCGIPAQEVEEKTYIAGTSASSILIDLLAMVKDLTLEKREIRRDYTYDNDVKVSGSLVSAIRQYSEVCGVSTFASNGKLYCYYLKDTKENGEYFNVSEDTGMIDSPMPYEEEVKVEDFSEVVEGFEIDMLLQHRISAGSIIKLDSEQYDGTYIVKSGTHTFNENECITHIKVV